MISKTDLRKSFRARLDESWSGEAAAQARESLNERLVEFLKDQSGLWAAFQPQGFEPDIRPALSRISAIEWVFPRVIGDHLEFYRTSGNDAEGCMVANRWGILEPDPERCEFVEAQSLNGLLIPGLAFDHRCNRLGRGRGFYDRFLSRMMARMISGPEGAPQTRNSNSNTQPKLKIGIAYDRQISETELPVETFDVPMDHVLTETRCFSRRTDGPSSWPAPHAGPPSQRKTS